MPDKHLAITHFDSRSPGPVVSLRPHLAAGQGRGEGEVSMTRHQVPYPKSFMNPLAPGPTGASRLLRLPRLLQYRLRQKGLGPGRALLLVSVAQQCMQAWSRTGPGWRVRSLVISTSRMGIGQEMDTHRTPLGLHRVAVKVGGGHPIGTVFRHRVAVGHLWQGQPEASICHRILWLEGLEPGYNRGGRVDTFRRYIYIHGFGDEPTLGRPASRGCIHVAGGDLLPLYDRTPIGTLVWIQAGELPAPIPLQDQ